MALKTEFELEVSSSESGFKKSGFSLCIIGKAPENKPYVSIRFGDRQTYMIPDKDLERFAVNILKALKSKRLKHYTTWDLKNGSIKNGLSSFIKWFLRTAAIRI